MRMFGNRGGKLILYAGTADGTMPYSLSYYYDRVAKQMGGLPKIQKWFRFFLVPGMGHCTGGTGPNTFNMLMELEKWVERNTAPVRIIASHLTGGVVDRTRPLCPYPKVARWNGRGGLDGVNHAENFKCIEPDYVLPPNDWDSIDHFPWDQ
jgi:feruloyl esterase